MKILNVSQTYRWKAGSGIFSVLHSSLSKINQIGEIRSDLLLLSNIREPQEIKCDYRIYHLDDFDWKELKSYDLIYYHSFYNLQIFRLLFLAKKYKIPFLIKPHGALMRNCVYSNNIVSSIKKILFIYFSTIFFKEIISGLVFINSDEKKNSVVLKGINTYYEKNSFAMNDYDVIEKKANKVPIFLYFSRIIPAKGIWELIDAFENRSDLFLSIVGSCSNQIKLKLLERIKELPNITYLGAIYEECEKKEIFSQVDFYVLPSYNEGFPTTVTESRYYGTPVVVTEECNCSEIIQAGYGFSLGRAQYMNWNILDRITQESMHKIKNIEYQKKCCEFVKKKFSIDSAYIETLNLYNEILNLK